MNNSCQHGGGAGVSEKDIHVFIKDLKGKTWVVKINKDDDPGVFMKQMEIKMGRKMEQVYYTHKEKVIEPGSAW